MLPPDNPNNTGFTFNQKTQLPQVGRKRIFSISLAVLLRFIHKLTARFALTFIEADFPPLFQPIHTDNVHIVSSQMIVTVLYVKRVVVTMIVLRVSLFDH